MVQTVIFGLMALVLGCAHAQNLPAEVVYQQGEKPVSLELSLAAVGPGQVVVIGEDHGTQVMASQQMQVLETLKKMGHLVSVGMEFFSYPHQASVDAWRSGNLSDSDFLKAVQWGQGFPFQAYKRQVRFPSLGSEFVVALNAPRELTGRIAQVGLEGLSEEETGLLPPDFNLGNPSYFERFKKVMGDHLPSPQALERYFAAQSTWDDTMAWTATQFLQAHPEQVLVIIVGEFHVQYGGGLPDRLRARGAQVTSFSLVNLFGLSESEQKAAVRPSSLEGARSDFVWTSRFETKLRP